MNAYDYITKETVKSLGMERFTTFTRMIGATTEGWWALGAKKAAVAGIYIAPSGGLLCITNIGVYLRAFNEVGICPREITEDEILLMLL